MGSGPLSAHDVARELRRRLPDAGVVKIQKLLYYAQAWHLTYRGEPLFHESIEAWANGPVVRDVWVDEKHGNEPPPRQEIDGTAAGTVDYVVGRYGHLTGKQLIDKTHTEDPWRELGESEEAFRSPEITHKDLMRFFQQDPEYVTNEAEAIQLREQRPFAITEPAMSLAMRRAVERVIGQPITDAV